MADLYGVPFNNHREAMDALCFNTERCGKGILAAIEVFGQPVIPCRQASCPFVTEEVRDVAEVNGETLHLRSIAVPLLDGVAHREWPEGARADPGAGARGVVATINWSYAQMAVFNRQIMMTTMNYHLLLI